MLRNDRYRVKKPYKTQFDIQEFVFLREAESDGFDIITKMYDPTDDRRNLFTIFRDTVEFNMEKINGKTS